MKVGDYLRRLALAFGSPTKGARPVGRSRLAAHVPSPAASRAYSRLDDVSHDAGLARLAKAEAKRARKRAAWAKTLATRTASHDPRPLDEVRDRQWPYGGPLPSNTPHTRGRPAPKGGRS